MLSLVDKIRVGKGHAKLFLVNSSTAKSLSASSLSTCQLVNLSTKNMPLSTSLLKSSAARLSFTACGVAPAAPVDEAVAGGFRRWIAEGNHAEMAYLANNVEKRLDPTLLVEGAQSVVSVALNYFPVQQLDASRQYEFAWYAYGQDYHDVMKARLTALAETLVADVEGDVHYRVFCDTAPVLERYWAWRCGLGWIGKNTQLIIPRAGSAFFLGEIIFDHPFTSYDEPQASRCGTCTRCLDACPTGALVKSYTLNARRCLSFLTIENRGDTLPAETVSAMGNCVYGCDRCQQACPWMRFARPTEVAEFHPKSEFLRLDHVALQSLSIEDYRHIFRGSAVKRAKYEGLMRNVKSLRFGPALDFEP